MMRKILAAVVVLAFGVAAVTWATWGAGSAQPIDPFAGCDTVTGDVIGSGSDGLTLEVRVECTPATTEPPTTTVPPDTTVPETTQPSTTTTEPAPTTTVTVPPTTVAPTTTTEPPQGAGFFEDFTGNEGLDRFRTGVFHRERDAFGQTATSPINRTWLADHDIRLADCGNPNVHRHPVNAWTDGDDASFYVCRDHFMTTMGDVSGYSVVWFAPDQEFDTISRVCWDANVSVDTLQDRQWWEVMIAPVGAPDVTAISWLAGTANLPNYADADAVVFGLGPDDLPHPSISVGNTRTYGPWPMFPSWGAAYTDVSVRVPHCFIDNGNGTLTYETRNADGTVWSFSAAGSFPAGPLKVVFKDHNYTPDKGCEDTYGTPCRSYTWHFDNIEVIP